MKLIFGMQVSMKACTQIDSMEMVKNSQSFQNNRLAMSLQYLNNELKAEVEFLRAEFPKSLVQHFEHQSCQQG